METDTKASPPVPASAGSSSQAELNKLKTQLQNQELLLSKVQNNFIQLVIENTKLRMKIGRLESTTGILGEAYPEPFNNPSSNVQSAKSLFSPEMLAKHASKLESLEEELNAGIALHRSDYEDEVKRLKAEYLEDESEELKSTLESEVQEAKENYESEFEGRQNDFQSEMEDAEENLKEDIQQLEEDYKEELQELLREELGI